MYRTWEKGGARSIRAESLEESFHQRSPVETGCKQRYIAHVALPSKAIASLFTPPSRACSHTVDRMQPSAFINSVSLPAHGTHALASTTRRIHSRRDRCRTRAPAAHRVHMQLPPPTHQEPPLTEEERGPPDYRWNPDFPGTLKPGSVDDNYPLEKVLSSGVYERMKFQELDMDERENYISPPDEDFLQWLAEQGRLLPRDVSEDEFDTEAEKQISGITEEDLDFADDDNKMIAYYSRQGEGTSAGASSDFGGFAEPTTDIGTGF